MKKLFTSALLVAVTLLQASAQQSATPGSIDNERYTSQTVPLPAADKKSKAFGKLVISEWYSYLNLMKEASLLPTTAGTVTFMMHDTLAKWVEDNDTVYYDRPLMAQGAVLDPKDDIIDQTSNPDMKLTKYNPYTIDSIAFRYLYVRYRDSLPDGVGGMVGVVDTLFLFYFTSPTITKNTFNPPHVFAMIPWDKPSRFPTGAVLRDTILLDSDDSTALPGNNEGSWAVKGMEVALKQPVNVPANGLFGFVGVFKPGLVYDTSFYLMHQGTGAKPSNDQRVNYFGFRSEADQQATKYINKTYYNTSMYGISRWTYAGTGSTSVPLGPGFVYTTPLYLDAFFKLTSGNVGIETITNDAFAMTNVYPNPVHAEGTALLTFNLKKSSEATVNIYSLMGQLVKTYSSEMLDAGMNKVELDLAGLNAGVYMVNMTVNGVTETRKLTIIE